MSTIEALGISFIIEAEYQYSGCDSDEWEDELEEEAVIEYGISRDYGLLWESAGALDADPRLPVWKRFDSEEEARAALEDFIAVISTTFADTVPTATEAEWESVYQPDVGEGQILGIGGAVVQVFETGLYSIHWWHPGRYDVVVIEDIHSGDQPIEDVALERLRSISTERTEFFPEGLEKVERDGWTIDYDADNGRFHAWQNHVYVGCDFANNHDRAATVLSHLVRAERSFGKSPVMC